MVGTMLETSSAPPSAVGLGRRVELLKALADPTRLAVVDLLASCGERCHCQLEEALAVPANRLSFHLRVLRDAGLVGTRRRGRRTYYHLHTEAMEAVCALLPTAPAEVVAAPCCAWTGGP